MAYIEIDEAHILERIKGRYNEVECNEVLNRVKNALEQQAPEDWRFTVSPTARFFVIDYKTQIKILGFSYRNFGKEIIEEIRKNILENTTKNIINNLKYYVDQYTNALSQPDIRIIHQLRTAYPKKEGEIGEEKLIYTSIKEKLAHIIPIREKKIAARPNAIVIEENELWVRQYLNWMDMNNPNKEYFLFEQLTENGINKARRKIFSYTINGDIKEESLLLGCHHGQEFCFQNINKEILSLNFRADSYWTLPTYLDRCLMDLEFREREAEKSEDGPLNRDEIVELYFIRRIVKEAKNKFKK